MRFILSLLFALFALPAAAQCVGENLLQTMQADKRAELDVAIAAHAYPSGNLWRATKNGSTIHIMGTFHLSDPRLDVYLDPLWPIIKAADLILLEGTRETLAQLQTEMATDPSLLFITDGPTLIDRLPTREWEDLSAAMSARGIPSFLVSKMQPWYASMMLSIPPCAMASMAEQNGVDQRIMAHAETHDIPTRALEAYDMVFSLLGGDDPEDELDAIRLALIGSNEADAMVATLTEAYLSGSHRAIWELSKHQMVEAQTKTDMDLTKMFAGMEAKMLTDRNANWMPVILEAAEEADNIVVAVGAAHLSGSNGVLYLLEQTGYALTRVEGF